jgi:hypothetical protein
MKGDTYDLFLFLDWFDEAAGQGAFAGKIATPLLDDDASKRTGVTAVQNLFTSFLAAEKAHRKEHSQHITKTARKKLEREQVCRQHVSYH